MIKKQKKAFTLIEAIVVAAIFAAFAAVIAVICVAGHFIAKVW